MVRSAGTQLEPVQACGRMNSDINARALARREIDENNET
jgi:hypothetical protein